MLGHDAGDSQRCPTQGCCEQTALPCWQRDLPVVRGGTNLLLGTCFHLWLRFANQHAARKVKTANTLAQLSKYLIPGFFGVLFAHALSEGVHLRVVHHKYSCFHFKDLFVKYTSLTCWRECQRFCMSTRRPVVPCCCAEKASLYPRSSSVSPGERRVQTQGSSVPVSKHLRCKGRAVAR